MLTLLWFSLSSSCVYFVPEFDFKAAGSGSDDEQTHLNRQDLPSTDVWHNHAFISDQRLLNQSIIH